MQSQKSWTNLETKQQNNYPDSIRFHQLRVNPTTIRLKISATSLSCYLYFWTIGYKSQIPKTPSSDLTDFLEQLTELRETFYSIAGLLWKDAMEVADEHPGWSHL